FHVRVRALDALPSGSSSLARGSENHSPEGLVLRRIPASQSEPFLGKRMAVRNTALYNASSAAGPLPDFCDFLILLLFHVKHLATECQSRGRIPFPSSGDEAGGPTTELFHVEQSCGSSLFHVSSVPWTPCPQDPRALPGEVKPQPERPRSFEEFQLLKRTVPGDFLTRLLFHVKHLASEAVLC